MVYSNNRTPANICPDELRCNEYGDVFRIGETYPLTKKVQVARALAVSSRNCTVPAKKAEIVRNT